MNVVLSKCFAIILAHMEKYQQKENNRQPIDQDLKNEQVARGLVVDEPKTEEMRLTLKREEVHKSTWLSKTCRTIGNCSGEDCLLTPYSSQTCKATGWAKITLAKVYCSFSAFSQVLAICNPSSAIRLIIRKISLGKITSHYA